ncbi:MAG: ANTAR domain-containing protein [Ruminococcus sp.]|nr:ANTAR domain-containing protein [Ruminococcus sp.]
MRSERPVYSSLIVSGYRKFTESLKQILLENDFTDPCTAESISEAIRLAIGQPLVVIFIRMSAPDEGSLAKMTQALAKSGTCTAVFTSVESYDRLFELVKSSGVYLIPLTPSRQMLLYSLDWLKAGCERVRNADRKNLTFDEKIRQLRMINRAVWQLIEREQLSEEQAQARLEDIAKSEGISKFDAAQRIIG